MAPLEKKADCRKNYIHGFLAALAKLRCCTLPRRYKSIAHSAVWPQSEKKAAKMSAFFLSSNKRFCPSTRNAKGRKRLPIKCRAAEPSPSSITGAKSQSRFNAIQNNNTSTQHHSRSLLLLLLFLFIYYIIIFFIYIICYYYYCFFIYIICYYYYCFYLFVIIKFYCFAQLVIIIISSSLRLNLSTFLFYSY